MTKPTISAAMIARNEEPYIFDCLQSIAEVADEIVLVDTGSTDRTAEMAADLGASVYHFEWDNDYAAARDESLRHVTGDWIFQIDPDERLRPASVPILLEAVKKTDLLHFNISVHNQGKPDPEPDEIPRLFRRVPGMHYTRPYHETVCPFFERYLSENPGWVRGFVEGIVLDHVGHATRSQDEMTQKTLRAIYIMERWLQKNPDDLYIAQKLVVSYAMIQRTHPMVMRDIRSNQGNILLNVMGRRQEAWAAYAGALTWDIEYRRQLQELEKKRGHRDTMLPAWQ